MIISSPLRESRVALVAMRNDEEGKTAGTRSNSRVSSQIEVSPFYSSYCTQAADHTDIPPWAHRHWTLQASRKPLRTESHLVFILTRDRFRSRNITATTPDAHESPPSAPACACDSTQGPPHLPSYCYNRPRIAQHGRQPGPYRDHFAWYALHTTASLAHSSLTRP